MEQHKPEDSLLQLLLPFLSQLPAAETLKQDLPREVSGATSHRINELMDVPPGDNVLFALTRTHTPTLTQIRMAAASSSHCEKMENMSAAIL